MSGSKLTNLVLLVVLFLAIWFGVWPLLGSVNLLRAVIENRQELVDVEREAITKILSTQQELESRQEDLDKLSLAVPSERDIATPIAIFEEAAGANGLVLSGLDVIEPESDSSSRQTRTTPSALGSFTANLQLTGRYGSITSFLENIESAFPLMEISNISFKINQEFVQSSGSGAPNPVMNILLTLESYYLNK